MEEWPSSHSVTITEELEVKGPIGTHVGQLPEEWNLPNEISSWSKLLRVTAYVRRFVYNIRKPQEKLREVFLSASEIRQARLYWIKVEQRIHFSKKLHDLCNRKSLRPNSSLIALTSFIDSDGILRVGGRPRRADLNESETFPVILPKSRLSELIIQYTHVHSPHGGLLLTLRTLRQHYWVVRTRNAVKTCILKCVTCARHRATMSHQRMGDLPDIRVKPSRPFTHTGVDYAGPFFIRSSKRRGHKTHKAYCVLFICLATRAIHLEVADDYTSSGFLAAFERFTVRRGLPAIVYSDNGINFQGANKELTKRIGEILKDLELQNQFASDEISWRFIPPAAPQFGGLWEAGVKGVKFHLKRILGEFTPTFEEFYTLRCSIECILNSRSFSPLYDDPENFDALTPGHFLVGSHLKSVPSPRVEDININRLTRWQTVQCLQERFWKVWSSDYLNSLQQRKKWRTSQDNLKVSDLVLLRNPNSPPSKWDMGRIIQCHTGDDKLVRVVTVKTSKSTLKRPVTQLCKLPVEPSTTDSHTT